MFTESILRQAVDDPVSFVRALLHRIEWLAKNVSPDQSHLSINWRVSMGRLLCQLLQKSPVLNADDLVAVCKIDALGYLGVAPSSLLLDLIAAHVAQHGWSIELADTVRAWHKSLHGSVSAQDLRLKVGWLLWFDNVSKIDPQECWSNRIRADLREMKPEVRAAWVELLENTSVAAVEKPPVKWKKPAAAAFKKVGAQEFRKQQWFECFQPGQPLRITTNGRDVLRNLTWYALLAADPEVDRAVARFASAQWKTKADKALVTKMLPSFAYVMIERSPPLAFEALEMLIRNGPGPLAGKTLRMYEQLCIELGHAPSASEPPKSEPPSRDETLRSLLKKMMTGQNASLEGDVVVVRGELDTYRIGIRDGRMTRDSDGRSVRLEIEMSTPALAPFRRMLDQADIQDPFAPNYFRIMLCAQILSRDRLEQRRIVADESEEA
jgi:hypothetical protein